MNHQSNLLTVEDLSILIKNQPIVEGISFNILRGEKVAIVGPSGSGKTLTAYSVANLLNSKFKIKARRMVLEDHSGGKINLLNPNSSKYHQIGFVFQEPQVALNPLYPIGKQLIEGLKHFIPLSEIEDKLKSILDDLNLPKDPSFLEAFPHEISGGQLQRVVIGIAIAKNPILLIADEPTTSLDSKTTVDILDLIMKMVDRSKMSLLLITHDQNIVYKYCDRVLPFLQSNNFKARPEEKISRVQAVNYKKNVLVELKSVNLYLKRRKNNYQPILQNLSISIRKGEILGLVGKSGSGKSSLCKILAGLVNTQYGELSLNCLPYKIQLVQQDPFLSLNPKFTVEETIGEVLMQYHIFISKKALQLKISSILDEVGLSDNYFKRKPIELSGGERQRIAIARSLAVEPDLLICDEAVSSLDFPTQRKIIDLIITLNANRQMAILFVAHDLSLVEFCPSICVLDGGKIVEFYNNEGSLNFSSQVGKELIKYNNLLKMKG